MSIRTFSLLISLSSAFAFISTDVALKSTIRVGCGRFRSTACSFSLYVPLNFKTQRLALRMSEGTTAVSECTGPAREGDIGNVDIDSSKLKSIAPSDDQSQEIIKLSENAKNQIISLKKTRGDTQLALRVGVRSGGCSGMSYVMEFEDTSKVGPMDTELKFDGFSVIVDPKSLMFIYGMTLDFSDALIGGGFKFHNPNAASTCGCGQSFGA